MRHIVLFQVIVASAYGSAITPTVVSPLANDDFDVSVKSSHASDKFALSSPSVLYDTAADAKSGCHPFLDSQINFISFPLRDATLLKFSVVDLRGNNFVVSGTLTADGVLSPFKVNCVPIFASALDGTAHSTAGAEWILSLYKGNDPDTVHALIHSEYYGGSFPQFGVEFRKTARCPSGQPLTCAYSVITAVVSKNGGRTFRRVGETPREYLVARPKFAFSPSYNATTGYFLNSNIVKKNDGYFYMMVTELTPGRGRSDCLLRTSTQVIPRMWRGYDGSRFDTDVPAGADCTGLAIKIAPFFIAYSTHFRSFIAVGTSLASPFDFAYALSPDLANWSDPVDLGIAPEWSPVANTHANGGVYNYPSLMDLQELRNSSDSNSSSGAVVGRNPWLLYIERSVGSTRTRLLARQLSFLNQVR